jgi:hypothetical protein
VGPDTRTRYLLLRLLLASAWACTVAAMNAIKARRTSGLW